MLFGEGGRPEKTFSCDAISADGRVVLEVEAGRGVTNYQFLKDLFQACMMAEVEYLVLGLRLVYRNSHDYERAKTFLETLYASDRLSLPLKGILLVGY